MEYDENDVYGSGLNASDWHLMKNAILYASFNPQTAIDEFGRLPEHLQKHEIGQIVNDYLENPSSGDLNTAAKMMIGGEGDGWLALMKS